MNICVLGAGAWGTAVAIHLSRLDHRVSLVARRMEHALAMASRRENEDYLPGFVFEPSLQVGCEIKPVLMEAEIIVVACPSKGLRALCREVKAALSSAWNAKMVITLCKGLELDTLKLPSAVLAEELPDIAHGVLTGPTFAGEVAAGKPAAMVLAANAKDALLREVQAAFNGGSLRVYRSNDVTGVELGGCLKNVYAIGAGICDGLKLGDNARASFLTRALNEMTRLGKSLGASSESIYGLSGFGDLVATCYGEWSRNRTFGQELAQGQSVELLMKERKTVVEGYFALDCFYQLCAQKKLEAPILDQIHAVAYRAKAPAEAIHALMSRELKAEI